ncbi:hypothetical protein [Persicitalea jodogahamensis]|uniref:Uncharacterized protein n=1 Tax=Persicitalea jodogahamensis TaxID=402147 RepID=A0A8J3DDZ0_9BACT|nr:hypothetical protein [Persicitalea jodogahamensis]GHB88989.1 hypothetical protein GCM10007390_51410 [Persicitalea jodogahamensis]
MKTNYIVIALFLFLSPLVSRAQTVFEVKFTSGLTQHRGALVLFDSGLGKMRVRYYAEGIGTQMVEQTVRFENTLNGYRVTGYNPVYPGTKVRHSTYIADNLYISRNEYGNFKVVNVDDRGVTAQASIRTVENAYERRRFLSDFDWELN